MMTLTTFTHLAQDYNTIPVYERILTDLLTPISAYLRIAGKARNSFLFESVEKGTQYSRYSFIGRNPTKILCRLEGKTTLVQGAEKVDLDEPFFTVMRQIMAAYSAPDLPELPAFTGGFVGYFGYETIVWTESIPIHQKNEPSIPDALFMLFEDLLAFDHLKQEIMVISHVDIHQFGTLEDAYRSAVNRIDAIGVDLHRDIDYQIPSQARRGPVCSNMSKKEFEDAVKKAKDYIHAGDIFQVVLSQRFQRQTSVDPILIYRALRTINPSPYMFYLKADDLVVLGASPELLVKVDGRRVEIRPIAGTRRRGKTAKEDQRLAKELLLDEKEQAEHLMLVDLGRNDVGKSAVLGSVNVKEYMSVENYSHVMHIVSGVEGRLRPGLDALDAFIAGFPAGTLTGAPKLRAMEIIYELEPERRGVYGGGIGSLDFSGNLDTCIAIRTMVVKGETVYFQSGAGIVFDSDPEKEYHETKSKAQALVAAIDLAENGLVHERTET